MYKGPVTWFLIVPWVHCETTEILSREQVSKLPY